MGISSITVACGLPVPAGFGMPWAAQQPAWAEGVTAKQRERRPALLIAPSFVDVPTVTVDRTRMSAPERSP